MVHTMYIDHENICIYMYEHVDVCMYIYMNVYI
jgi:hypothetical protein